LVMFNPLGQEGHTLFSSAAGRYLWLPEMDAFLRFQQLPTWQRRDVDVLLKRPNGSESNRGFLEGFLAAPFEKALVRVASENYKVFGVWGTKTIGDARKRVLDDCGKQWAQAQCLIVLENNNWVGSTE